MLACIELTKGSGPPLVFLHGFLGTSADWKPVCSFLPQANCFGVDLPGHGMSSFTPHFYDMMPLFDAPIHLIGYSMGGRLAIEYAKRYPERIDQLTLLSTHPGLKDPEEKRMRLEHDRKWASRLLHDDFDAFLQAWYNQPIFGGFIPDLETRKQQNRKVLAQALVHYSLGNQTYFKPEANYLVGERDTKFRALHPQATIIPRAAHALHLENPQEVAAQISNWTSLYVF